MHFQRSEAGEWPYSEYYVWADAGAEGGPPNNWLSKVGSISMNRDLQICTNLPIVFLFADSSNEVWVRSGRRMLVEPNGSLLTE